MKNQIYIFITVSIVLLGCALSAPTSETTLITEQAAIITPTDFSIYLETCGVTVSVLLCIDWNHIHYAILPNHQHMGMEQSCVS